jgi:hypothetical protein
MSIIQSEMRRDEGGLVSCDPEKRERMKSEDRQIKFYRTDVFSPQKRKCLRPNG